MNILKLKFNNLLFIKIILFCLFFICFILFFKNNVLAATLKLETSQQKFHQQEEFFVDIFLAPEKEEDVNGFDIALSFSSNLTFLGFENGSSITGLWIEKPTLYLNSVHLSGIIPGGFKGLINPLNSDPINNQKSGLIARLFFTGNGEGDSLLNLEKQNILANDGNGTILNTNSNILSLFIDDKIIPSKITINDIEPPKHFSILISKDPLLFDNKYTIIFDAKDKESGIDYYEVKELGKDWKKAESPYVTSHQPPIGTIYVKAIDRAGNTTIEEITPNISIIKDSIYVKLITLITLIVLVIFLVVFFVFIKKKKTL